MDANGERAEPAEVAMLGKCPFWNEGEDRERDEPA